MADMPTSYLAEKAHDIGRAGDRLYKTDGFIDTWDAEVSHLRLLAQSIVEEIDKWRGQ